MSRVTARGVTQQVGIAALAASLWLLAATGAIAQTTQSPPPAATPPVATPAPPAQPAQSPPPMSATDSAQRVAMNSSPTTALRPGDVLRLRIWREENMSGDFPVDERGMAVLPRLGALPVTGMSAEQLRQQLVERYRQYLNNPSIEVTPLRRIAVIGAVRNPGTYTVDPAVTLGGAANVAGGSTQQGKRNVLELHRGKERRELDIEKHPEYASLPLASGDQVFVPERSWLSQNATWFVSTLVAIGTTAAIIIAD